MSEMYFWNMIFQTSEMDFGTNFSKHNF